MKVITAKSYKESFGNIKEELGNYKLSVLTQYILNQALIKLYQISSTKEALRSYQNVIKSSLRDATYYFGFIKALRNGNEIKDISKLLGHSRTETTEYH